MRINPLADEVKLILDQHHNHEIQEVDGEEVTVPTTPIDDAPVFVYRPLNPREKTRWLGELSVSDETATFITNDRYIDLVQERLIRVDNLIVGDELFEVDKHFDALPLEWLMELSMSIIAGASLSEDDLGKSS